MPPDVLEAPRQVAVRAPLQQAVMEGTTYTLRPRYSYELRGIVVSMHDTETWWNYVHKEVGDKMNAVDLCVVWGDNVSSGAYRQASFHNTQFECHWRYGAGTAFNDSQVSNNHMITDDPAVARRLRAVRIGDQVQVRGYLVDYTVQKAGHQATPWRVSSETRGDTGAGACEVIFVEDLQLLGKGPAYWRMTLYAALALLVLGLVAWLVVPPDLSRP